MRLGELERAVIEVLWDRAPGSAGEGCSARQVAETLPNHAYTTVLTVLDRLRRKGLVTRTPSGKAYLYTPTGSRESYTAQLMHDALAATSDRRAALIHFAETVSSEDSVVLRDVLRRMARQPGGGTPQ